MITEDAALAFEAAYAERSRISVDQLRQYKTVRRCHCDAEMCEGYAMVSVKYAAEWDAEAPLFGKVAGSVIAGRP